MPRPLPLCAAALLLAACSSSQHKGAELRPDIAGSKVTVPVELTEYKIRMPDSIPEGDVTFTVRNIGSHTHTIQVAGPGVTAKLPEALKPGQTGELIAHLAPGTYRVTCPIDSHTALGMRRTLTVTAR
jgi:uncharacterized cupredoxin-like copper-binding protein